MCQYGKSRRLTTQKERCCGMQNLSNLDSNFWVDYRPLVTDGQPLYSYFFFQSLVMSSKVLPLVSGTRRQTKTAAITQMMP